jgi:hypothetical protein
MPAQHRNTAAMPTPHPLYTPIQLPYSFLSFRLHGAYLACGHAQVQRLGIHPNQQGNRMQDMNQANRRRLLKMLGGAPMLPIGGVSMAALLAGCNSSDDDDPLRR